jgi:hypothetical protein
MLANRTGTTKSNERPSECARLHTTVNHNLILFIPSLPPLAIACKCSTASPHLGINWSITEPAECQFHLFFSSSICVVPDSFSVVRNTFQKCSLECTASARQIWHRLFD